MTKQLVPNIKDKLERGEAYETPWKCKRAVRKSGKNGPLKLLALMSNISWPSTYSCGERYKTIWHNMVAVHGHQLSPKLHPYSLRMNLWLNAPYQKNKFNSKPLAFPVVNIKYSKCNWNRCCYPPTPGRAPTIIFQGQAVNFQGCTNGNARNGMVGFVIPKIAVGGNVIAPEKYFRNLFMGILYIYILYST